MNLLTATVHRVGVASPPTPQTLSFPVDEVFLCEASDATNAAIQAFVEHRGKKYYCVETVAELVSAVGSGLLQVSVTEKDGRPIPATQMAFPLEDCALSGVGSGTGYVEYKGKKYYAASFVVGGEPFSGTASELRDALAGVFGGSEIASAKDYGAKGDGVTDDTNAIQQFVSACAANNKKGELPDGTYLIGNITGASDLRLSGNGTLKLKGGLNGTALEFSGCSNVYISGIRIDGNKAGQTAASAALYFSGCSGVVVQDVVVDGAYGSEDSDNHSAITFDGCTKVVVDNTTVVNTLYNGMIFRNGCTYCLVRGGNYSDNGYSGISTITSDYITLEGVTATGNGTSNLTLNGNYNKAIGCTANGSLTAHGINLGHPGALYNCDGSQVIGGTFLNNALYGVSVYGDATYTQNNIVVNGVYCKGNEVGVWTSYVNNSQFIGVFTEDNTQDGVQVWGNRNLLSHIYARNNAHYDIWVRSGNNNRVYPYDAATFIVEAAAVNTDRGDVLGYNPNVADQAVNFEKFLAQWASNIVHIGTTSGGTGIVRDIRIGAASTAGQALPGKYIQISSALPNFRFVASTGNTNGSFIEAPLTSTAASGTVNILTIDPTINQSGTAGYRALWFPIYEQALGSGIKKVLSIGTCTAANGGGTYTEKFGVDSSGGIAVNGAVAVSGSFTTQDGKTVTVTNGLITAIT